MRIRRLRACSISHRKLTARPFDILLLDTLHAQAPLLRCIARHGWDVVISLKRNQPKLYQSAMWLFVFRPADQDFRRSTNPTGQPGNPSGAREPGYSPSREPRVLKQRGS